MSDWKVKYRLLDVLFSSCGMVVPSSEKKTLSNCQKKETSLLKSMSICWPLTILHIESEMRVTWRMTNCLVKKKKLNRLQEANERKEEDKHETRRQCGILVKALQKDHHSWTQVSVLNNSQTFRSLRNQLREAQYETVPSSFTSPHLLHIPCCPVQWQLLCGAEIMCAEQLRQVAALPLSQGFN